MAFFTAGKRGKMSKMKGKSIAAKDLTPPTMYSAVDFGGGRPDSSRRMTNNYGVSVASIVLKLVRTAAVLGACLTG
jgi:hypothetical protein